MAGRRSSFTPDRVQRILTAIRMGATYRLACDYAGISEDTFGRWRDQHADFAAQLKEAEGAAVVGWLAKIEQAASDGNWQAAAWKLERRYPDMYGRQRMEVTGAEGGALKIEVAWVDEKSSEDDA